MSEPFAIDLSAVKAAQNRLAGHAVVTPLLSSPELDRRVGARLLIKAEPLQRTGSFKFRGAYNRISQIPPEQRAGGVVAYSSGNHAQAVAYAAAQFGMPAVIVMPRDAPTIKIANTKAYGGDVVLYDRYGENREAIGAAIAAERGATIVPPYDDPDVMAGQGTIGLEMVAQAAAMGQRLDILVSCCGGGGLMAGIATAVHGISPATALYAAEPENFDDTRRSLAFGERVSNSGTARTICDAIMTPTPGELTFPINRRLLAGAVTATDTEVLQAMAIAAQLLKLVVEPGGAVALAATLAGRLETAGKTIGIVCSGGNVDPAMFARAVAVDV